MASESLAVRSSTPPGRSWPLINGWMPLAETTNSVPLTVCTMARPVWPPDGLTITHTDTPAAASTAAAAAHHREGMERRAARRAAGGTPLPLNTRSEERRVG